MHAVLNKRAIELLKNNFESLFVGAGNEQAVDNFNFHAEDLLTDFFTYKEGFERGITTVTNKEIQAKQCSV